MKQADEGCAEFGIFNFEDGSRYYGSVNQTQNVHGFGMWTDASGSQLYEGQLRNGAYHGRGRTIWVDGEVYCGNYVENRKSGFGKETYASGDSYAGSFLNDKKHGKGIYQCKNGATYTGEFKDGKRHGFGTATL